MDSYGHEDAGITRRGALFRLGAFLAAAVAGEGWKAASAESTSAGPLAVASGAVTCVLAPEQTEGPYYIAGEKVRRDIREGHPGVPLALRVTVVDASTCKAIKGAAVDIWHCDASGAYSGVGQAAGGTFLRGIQRTDAKGVATFTTIYPGWYPGRTVHIHVKVHLGGNVVHTGQLYFPDSLPDTVFRRRPYSNRPNRSTRNATDSVYRNGGKRSLLTPAKKGSGYTAKIALGVQRS
jgi:protocatechuate 3,4-dioxygenase beta subunit